MTQTEKRDRFLKALGEMNVEFAGLENIISRFIMWLANPLELEIGEIIVCELSIKAKLALLLSLYRHRIPDKNRIKELEKVLENIRKVNKRRNDNTHSSWNVMGEEALRHKQTAKYENGFKSEMKLIHIKEINDIIGTIKLRNQELMKQLVNYRNFQYEKERQAKEQAKS
jgi:hypothetical protein